MKTITINLNEDKAGVYLDPSLTVAESLQLYGTLGLHILNTSLDAAKRQIKDPNQNPRPTKLEMNAAITGVQESLYDAMNNIISTVLAEFYPDAPRNSIDENAIIELTNQEINRRYNALSDKEKAKYSSAYHTMKAKLMKDIQVERTKHTK